MLPEVGCHFEFQFQAKNLDLTPSIKAVVRFLQNIIRSVNALHTKLHLCPCFGPPQLLSDLLLHSLKISHKTN